jgi:hypothetical protein
MNPPLLESNPNCEIEPFCLSFVQDPVPDIWGNRAAHACGRASREASRLASAARI